MAQSTTLSSPVAPPPPTTTTPQTWIIVGASRGIGLEFTRQLLARGDQVIAVVRDPMKAAQLWQVLGEARRPGGGVIEQCDVTKESDILVSQFFNEEGRPAGRGREKDVLADVAGGYETEFTLEGQMRGRSIV
jgi:NAD(P)-dependent dehydrogenase (short-subunit alcohol dehydrogenase family)